MRLRAFLAQQVSQSGRFPEEPTYGYAFQALAEALGPRPDLDVVRLAIESQANIDRSWHNYPWEFVTYACVRARAELAVQTLSGPEAAETIPEVLCNDRIVRGTRVTNWRLLRLVNSVMLRGPSVRVRCAARLLGRVFTTKAGLIQDQLWTRSLQYHAFSLFLVAELHRCCRWPFLLKWLNQGLRASAEFTLPDGTAMYLGRGQEQIFGYGAFLAAGEYALTQTKTRSFEGALSRALRRLVRFQRSDGSFPLVLREREPEPSVARRRDIPPGWYGYNSLYDYLPFLAACLGAGRRSIVGGPYAGGC